MTLYFSYIGDTDDRDFCRDGSAGGPAVGKLPRRVVPAQCHANITADGSLLLDEFRKAMREGRRLDWGAWGLEMTGRQLVEYFGPGHPHAADIAALDSDRHYVLVTGEA